MFEREKGSEGSSPETFWQDIPQEEMDRFSRLLCATGEQVIPVEAVITTEAQSQFHSRFLLTELALRRLMDNRSFPRAQIQPLTSTSESSNSTRSIHTITHTIHEQSAVAVFFVPNPVTVPDRPITARVLIFARNVNANEEEYNKARTMLVRETNILLSSVEQSPYPPHP